MEAACFSEAFLTTYVMTHFNKPEYLDVNIITDYLTLTEQFVLCSTDVAGVVGMPAWHCYSLHTGA
jgi:hypothetical protein